MHDSHDAEGNIQLVGFGWLRTPAEVCRNCGISDLALSSSEPCLALGDDA